MDEFNDYWGIPISLSFRAKLKVARMFFSVSILGEKEKAEPALLLCSTFCY